MKSILSIDAALLFSTFVQLASAWVYIGGEYTSMVTENQEFLCCPDGAKSDSFPWVGKDEIFVYKKRSHIYHCILPKISDSAESSLASLTQLNLLPPFWARLYSKHTFCNIVPHGSPIEVYENLTNRALEEMEKNVESKAAEISTFSDISFDFDPDGSDPVLICVGMLGKGYKLFRW